MTRLDLANKFRRKSGTPGYFETNVTNNALNDQTGEYGDLVDWLDQAYELVQTHYDTWLFLREQFTFDTVSGTSEYAALTIKSDFGSWNVDDWRYYLKSYGIVGEQHMIYLDWDTFKYTYLFGSSRSNTGQPIYFTVAPDKAIHLYPVPDDIYVIGGEYYKEPDVMSLDDDEPIFHERYQWGIVWIALEMYGSDADEPNKEITGSAKFRRFILSMSKHYLPKFSTGGPLV